MAGNPLVALGTLNRLRGSVTISNFSQLNVTASYLGEEGITLALEGESSTRIRAMTGVVQSPEPYMDAQITIQLLKTQGLAAQYKAKMESNVLLGDIVVRPDASSLPDYQFSNVSISDVREMKFNGKDAGFMIVLTGTYNINNDLFNI